MPPFACRVRKGVSSLPSYLALSSPDFAGLLLPALFLLCLPIHAFPSPPDLSRAPQELFHSSARRQLINDDPAFQSINRQLGINPRLVPVPTGYVMLPPTPHQNRSRGRRVILNFAKNCCAHAQYRNCASAIKFGADLCLAHNFSAVPEAYQKRNAQIFEAGRGAGFWSWKPFLIFQALVAVEEGDYVIYSDTAQDVINELEPLCELALPDRPVFEHFPAPNDVYVKQDAFLLIGCTNHSICQQGRQVQASFFVFRKSAFSLAVVSKWMAYAQDARVITDDVSTLRAEDVPTFHQNRHDQAIVSLLFAMGGLTPPPLPGCQWKEFMCRIDHHRRKD